MSEKLPFISLEDYNYSLPSERIADYPLPRGTAKLIHYKNGTISHKHFSDITELLSEKHQLVYNNTKVLPARLFFYRETGAKIEIFLLAPISPTKEVTKAMLVNGECVWECAIGNSKKWKNDILKKELEIGGKQVTVSAELLDRANRLIKFSWDNKEISFVDLVEAIGKTPLPPYIKREADENDKDTYQTVYSKQEGAVAAPTAGLHFSEQILETIQSKNIDIQEVTLHVGAGTFKPVTEENALEHDMHQEQVEISKATIESLISEQEIVAVGTTSMRTLESLYWFGVKLLENKQANFHIEKLFPYQFENRQLPTKNESLKTILEYMESENLERLFGTTEIFIFPTYEFRMCKALITNFHMPKSTLLLLVSAFIGQDWLKIYHEAMENEYRFLSYGDSSFLELK
ncbi:MAG: S-adenosylmethionine:tRNA ribosyltransferase-isomerase [Bacteroidia bacterium]|jgi:S-adenosylmethionine:tRNA ribosyltransferase-isomerase